MPFGPLSAYRYGPVPCCVAAPRRPLIGSASGEKLKRPTQTIT